MSVNTAFDGAATKSRFGKVWWILGSLVFGLAAIGLQLASLGQAALAMRTMAGAAQLKADGRIGSDQIDALHAEARVEAHRSGLIGSLGLLSAAMDLLCLIISIRCGWSSGDLAPIVILCVYGVSLLVVV
jgi:hypothetical protein